MSALSKSIQDYSDLIKQLDAKSSDSLTFDALVLEALSARDKVQVALAKEAEQPSEENEGISGTSFGSMLLTLNESDRQLKANADNRGWAKKVDNWRTSRGASDQSWWWHSNSLHQSHSSPSFLILNVVNFVFLVPIVGLIITTSGRLLALDLNFLGTSTIVLQGFLGFLASKTTLTASSHWLDWIVMRSQSSERSKPFIKLLFTMLIGGLALLVNYVVLPNFSQRLVQKARQNYQQGLYSFARSNLESAINVDPNNKAALHSLGKVYEVMSDADHTLWEQARAYYTRAMDGGVAAGSNSLARLFILDGINEKDNSTKRKNYYKATRILGQTSNKSRCLDDENEPSQISDSDNFNLDSYNNCTNLGWAYLELYKIDEIEGTKKSGKDKETHEQILEQFLNRAREHLDKAIEVWEDTLKNQGGKPNKKMFEYKEATAYCLRAQVFEEFAAQALENQKNPEAYEAYQAIVQQDWRECFNVLENEEARNPYEVEWYEESKTGN